MRLDQIESIIFGSDQSPGRLMTQSLIEACAGLGPAERRVLTAEVVERIGGADEGTKYTAEAALRTIACVLPGWWAPAADILARCDQTFGHGIAFLQADAVTRDQLVRRFEDDGHKSGLLLECLAWVGDGEICRLFDRWRREPPGWAGVSPAPPWLRSREAGWELTPAGARRDLFSPSAYSLVPDESPPATAGGPVGVNTPHEGSCRWCGRGLACLFEFDLRDGRVSWLGLRGERLRVALCDRCSARATLYTLVDGHGKSEWHPANERPGYGAPDNGPDGGPDDEPEWQPTRRLTLGPPRVSPYEANASEFDPGLSQVGGHPTWISGAHYPPCPSCGQAMPAIGQLLTEDVMEFAEGMSYAFLCGPCGVAATVYQQT